MQRNLAPLFVILAIFSGCDGLGEDAAAKKDQRTDVAVPAVADAHADAKAKADAEAALAKVVAEDIAAGRRNAAGKPLARLTVTVDHARIPLGAAAQLTALGLYEDGLQVDLSGKVSWSTPEVAVVAAPEGGLPGLFVGANVGVAVITGQLGLVSGTTTVEVSDAWLIDLAITTIPVAAPAGGAGLRFHVEGTYSDGSKLDLTNVAAWDSQDTMIALVDDDAEKGFTRTIQAGTATIQAVHGGKVALKDLAVLEAVLVSLHVDDDRSGTAFKGCVPWKYPEMAEAEPYRPQHFVGDIRWISAYGYYSDCSYRWLDEDVAFASSNPAVASFDEASYPNELTQHAAGTTVVTITLGTLVSAPKTYTVHPVTVLGFGFDTDDFDLPDYCDNYPTNDGDSYGQDGSGLWLDVYVALSNCEIGYPDFAVTWSSSDNAVAKFEDASQGYLSFVKDGNVTVTVTPDPATGLTAVTKQVAVDFDEGH